MIKISKLSDYAMLVLICLDSHKKMMASSMLAQETGVPEPTVAKVLKMLAHAKLVQSYRGARSGYELTTPLHSISIAQIISVIDGPIQIANCDDDRCKVIAGKCALYRKWDFVNQMIQDSLSSISLLELRDKQPKINFYRDPE